MSSDETAKQDAVTDEATSETPTTEVHRDGHPRNV